MTSKTHKNDKPRVISLTDKSLENEIQSEVKFLWTLLKQTLAIPFVLILILFGKRKIGHLFDPIKTIYRFIFSAKFTINLIIINILIFISQIFMSETVFNSLATYPTDLFSIRIFSIITSGFLHGSLMHLLGNMAGIFIFGRVVERKLGARKTAYLYFGALIISGIFSSLLNLFVFSNNIGGIGASGALMGLLSTAILLDPFYITHDLLFPLPVMFLGWFYLFLDLQSVFYGVEDGIGHLAHIGGFISISVIFFFMEKNHRNKLKKGLGINLISAAIFGIIYLVLL